MHTEAPAGGLAINPETAEVIREDGSEINGLYAAGELVGGLFYSNYPGGSGLTAGGVFVDELAQRRLDICKMLLAHRLC